MTAYAQSDSKVVPQGVSKERIFWTRTILAQALTSSDTLALTLPDGVPPDALPVQVICYAPESSNVRTRDADIGAVTSHNVSTGVTTITPTGNVAINSTVLVQYVGSS